MKMVLITGYLATTLLGSFCPMQMAAAMPMAQDSMQHEQMDMTPVEPMSPAHCEHCLRVTEQKSQPAGEGCAGHCLSKAADASSAVVSTSRPLLAGAALPALIPVLASVPDTNHGFIESTAPPGNFPLTRTVVLLQ